MQDGVLDPDPDPPDDLPGEVVVWNALRKLQPDLDRSIQNDPEKLAEALLDAGEQFDGTRLLYLMTALFVPILDPLAQDLCTTEYLLLDARELTNECVVSLFTGFIDGTRERPFMRWARQRLRRAAQRAAQVGEIPLFANESMAPRARFMRELAKICNRCAYTTRRLAWLAFVEGRSYRDIAAMSDIPLERVEAHLKHLIHLGRLAMHDDLDGKKPQRAPSLQQPFWKPKEGDAHE